MVQRALLIISVLTLLVSVAFRCGLTTPGWLPSWTLPVLLAAAVGYLTNAIAIMILTNCVMPLANFFILRWVLAETFHVTLPIPEVRRKGRSDPDAEAGSGSDASALVTAGE